MDTEKILNNARSALSAERVYGTPVERDGVTVIPAAKISGGGGGGGDDGGSGGGFGVHARPVGALIVEAGGNVRWKGIIDVNRIIIGGQLVGIALFLSVWLTERSKARAAMKAVIATAAIERVGRRRAA